jgi:hypothetical protein
MDDIGYLYIIFTFNQSYSLGLLWEICQLNLFIPTNPLDIEEWL